MAGYIPGSESTFFSLTPFAGSDQGWEQRRVKCWQKFIGFMLQFCTSLYYQYRRTSRHTEYTNTHCPKEYRTDSISNASIIRSMYYCVPLCIMIINNSARPLSHQRPFIITPPSVGNKAEKQCLPSYKPHNLSANPLSVQFFVSLWFFIYSSLFEMEVACWTGPSFAGFS